MGTFHWHEQACLQNDSSEFANIEPTREGPRGGQEPKRKNTLQPAGYIVLIIIILLPPLERSVQSAIGVGGAIFSDLNSYTSNLKCQYSVLKLGRGRFLPILFIQSPDQPPKQLLLFVTKIMTIIIIISIITVIITSTIVAVMMIIIIIIIIVANTMISIIIVMMIMTINDNLNHTKVYRGP